MATSSGALISLKASLLIKRVTRASGQSFVISEAAVVRLHRSRFEWLANRCGRERLTNSTETEEICILATLHCTYTKWYISARDRSPKSKLHGQRGGSHFRYFLDCECDLWHSQLMTGMRARASHFVFHCLPPPPHDLPRSSGRQMMLGLPGALARLMTSNPGDALG